MIIDESLNNFITEPNLFFNSLSKTYHNLANVDKYKNLNIISTSFLDNQPFPGLLIQPGYANFIQIKDK